MVKVYYNNKINKALALFEINETTDSYPSSTLQFLVKARSLD
jgi:hypothetical protein